MFFCGFKGAMCFKLLGVTGAFSNFWIYSCVIILGKFYTEIKKKKTAKKIESDKTQIMITYTYKNTN